eukprot:8220686-Pyramimonas_sp.AAC.1
MLRSARISGICAAAPLAAPVARSARQGGGSGADPRKPGGAPRVHVYAVLLFLFQDAQRDSISGESTAHAQSTAPSWQLAAARPCE